MQTLRIFKHLNFKLKKFLLEAPISSQEFINCFLRRLDQGFHKMKGAIASLLTATHHTCIFYAHSLKCIQKNIVSALHTLQIWKPFTVFDPHSPL